MTNDEIKQAVNKIIELLDKKDFKSEAINWADLKVNSVQTEYRVWIDEADPAAALFRQRIEEVFHDKYGFEIEIITEW